VSTPSPRPISPLVQGLFTWTGVLPLGVFLVVHLGVNTFALLGAARFGGVLGTIHRVRGLGILEACFILAPLAVHGVLGGWLVVTRRSLRLPRPYPPQVRLAMRVASIGVLAFLAMHLPEFRWRGGGERLGGSETADLLAADLSWTWQGMPWRGLAYLVGAACAAFHFGAGLWGMYASSTRGQASRRARVAWAWAFGMASFALWLGFANVVVAYATGAALFAGPPAADTDTGPCPAPRGPPH
jgi:succinate dehydrogenase / fumarate reductase, cytochrome b subunit